MKLKGVKQTCSRSKKIKDGQEIFILRFNLEEHRVYGFMREIDNSQPDHIWDQNIMMIGCSFKPMSQQEIINMVRIRLAGLYPEMV